ncbi:MAG: hypothetical protein V7607_1659 [Solirubrobacteraceae bacterium]
MPLRDLLIAPREAASEDEAVASRGAAARGRLGFPVRARTRPEAGALAPSLGVLADARDLAAVAVAVGVVVARRGPAALVCLDAPGHGGSAPALRAPARAASARLAAALRARGLDADARGRVAVVDLSRGVGDAARALAAAGSLPTVLGVAVRDPERDALLAAQDAILVALAASTDPALAGLAISSAARLVPSAASIAVSLDPASRALALGGLRVPAAVRVGVEGVLP